MTRSALAVVLALCLFSSAARAQTAAMAVQQHLQQQITQQAKEIVALKDRIAALEAENAKLRAELAEAKAGATTRPAEPEVKPYFQEPIQVGDVAVAEGYRIVQIQGKDEALVEVKIKGMPKYSGSGQGTGAVYGPGSRMQPVFTKAQDLLEWQPFALWLKGVSMTGKADDLQVPGKTTLKITGSKTFTTVTGAKRTVFVAEPPMPASVPATKPAT
jgi:cell division protein FtsB